MRPACAYTDFFVVAPAATRGRRRRSTTRSTAAQARGPAAALGRRPGEATWIVADYLDVVLHVFTPETRAYYRLEDLWGDVPAVELEAATA